jgi:hypothetical protein
MRQDKHIKYLINEYMLDNIKPHQLIELVNLLINENSELKRHIAELRRIG